jgi:hypothetical protein
MDLPPVRFLVEGVLPEGTGMLSAPSKVGKSWMVLDMGLSIAAGRPFLGHETRQGGVLYLALEDSANRLQERMNRVLEGGQAPGEFYFLTQAPTLDTGLLDLLDGHIRAHPDTRLVIVDTLQKVRGQARAREQAYAQDYREMGTVKAHMEKRGVSVFFVHHNRKMRDDDDPFNMISGTNGIMGAADTIWVLTKDKRSDGSATLHITGRDVEQRDTVLRFHKTRCRWQVLGDAADLAQRQARENYDASPVVLTIKKLLSQSPEGRWEGTAKDLMEAGKYMAGTYLAPSAQKLGYLLRDLEQPMYEFDGIMHTAIHRTEGKTHSFCYREQLPLNELPGEQVPFSNM